MKKNTMCEMRRTDVDELVLFLTLFLRNQSDANDEDVTVKQFLSACPEPADVKAIEDA